VNPPIRNLRVRDGRKIRFCKLGGAESEGYAGLLIIAATR
jgi:hypothetical protein